MKTRTASCFAAIVWSLVLSPSAFSAAVTWTGGGDGVSWNNAQNWTGGTGVPGAADDATIGVVAGNPTIKITTVASVKRLTCSEPLNITGGSLTMAAASSISAGLTVSNATVTGAGASASITISGPTTLTDANLNAQNGAVVSYSAAATLTRVNLTATGGGQLLFLAAKTYTSSSSGSKYTISASGSGSKISLSALTSFAGSSNGGSNADTITASTGGEVDLAGAFSGGFTTLTLSDAASVLNVAGVTSLQDTSVSAVAGTINFSALTALTRVSLSATGGGQLLFPKATSYTSNSSGSSYAVLASGTGSKINLSALTSFAGSFNGGSNADAITASTGGEVDLAGAFSGGFTTLTLSDAASVLNVAGVTSLQDTSVSAVAGTINFSALTALTRVGLSARAGAQVLFPAATTYTSNTSGSSYAILASGTGSKINLSALTSFAGSFNGGSNADAITASTGGEVDLAGAFSGGFTTLTLSDAASVLNVAGLTSLQDTNVSAVAGTINFSSLTALARVSLSATGGGQLLFPKATSYTSNSSGSSYAILASGTGSKINLSALTSFAGSFNGGANSDAITASAGGEVDLAGAFSGGFTILTLSDAASVLNVAGVTSLQDASINAVAGTINFSALTALTRVYLSATGGGQLLFPAATTYTSNTSGESYAILASGTGSKINLSSLTSFAGSFNSGASADTITASTGGEVDLAGAFSGYTSITADKSSQLGVGGVTKLDGVTLNTAIPLTFTAVTELTDTSLTAAAVTFSYPNVTALTRVNLSATGGGQLFFPKATTYTSNTSGSSYAILASGTGSKINLSALTSFAGSFNGGSNADTITASTGGEVDLAGAFSGGFTTLTLSDAASVINVAGVTSLQDTSVSAVAGTINFSALTTLTRVSLSATGGGQLLFPAAMTYTSNSSGSSYAILANGTGSKINLSVLTSFAGSFNGGSNADAITASIGGEVDLAGAFSGGFTTLTLSDAASVINVAGVTSLQDTSVSAVAGTINFSALITLARVSLSATGGGQLLFPAAKTYTSNTAGISYAILASGTGSTINLSALTSFAGSFSGGGNADTITASNGGEVDVAGALSGGFTALTLSDAASTLNISTLTSLSNTTLTAGNTAIWTFPSNWNPVLNAGVVFTTSGTGQIINQSSLTISGAQLSINTNAFDNQGILNPVNGGAIAFNGSFRVDGSGSLTGNLTGNLTITGNLLGNTVNAQIFDPQATITFKGSGTASAPQLLEAMSQDLAPFPRDS